MIFSIGLLLQSIWTLPQYPKPKVGDYVQVPGLTWSNHPVKQKQNAAVAMVVVFSLQKFFNSFLLFMQSLSEDGFISYSSRRLD